MGLVIVLLASGCSEGSGGGNDQIQTLKCNLLDSPGESLEYRYVMTEEFQQRLDAMTPIFRENFEANAGGLPMYAYLEYRWSVNAPWMREEIIHKPATPLRTLAACSSFWRDKAVTTSASTSTPTTKPKPKPTTTKASSGGSEDYNERLAKCYFDEERPGYDFAGGGQRDDAAMIVCLGRVKE